MEGDVAGTRDYFLQELRAFREMMGSRDAWEPPEKMAKALTGLLYVYLKTEGITETDRELMLATTDEYDHRLALVLTVKLNTG